MAARPREPRSLLRGPAAAALLPHTGPQPGNRAAGPAGPGLLGAGALEAPRLPRGNPLRPAGRAGPGLPSPTRGAEPGGRGNGSPPLPRSPSGRRGRSRPACPHSALFFFFFFGFPRWVTGPVSAALDSPAARRLRARRPVSRRRRERERNFGLPGPGGGRSGPAVSRAPARIAGAMEPRSPGGPAEGGITERPAAAAVPGFRSALPGRWVWICAFAAFHLPPREEDQ